MRPGDGWLCAVALACALAATLGCGASPAVREAYARETAACVAAEAAIVARPDTTLEEDREALRVERARCDAARHEIVGGAQ